MNAPSEIRTRQDSPPPAPYDELYVYYLEGRPPADCRFDATFIGNWQEEESAFLFFSRPRLEAVEALVRACPGLILIDHYQISYEQWQGGRLRPFTLGRFDVCPPWDPTPALKTHPGYTAPILLDPGVVFGTGTHPTTRDCVAALEMAATGQIGTVLDLGTGTGLLALVAARLGCGPVLAVDFNFLAARTALTNVRLNGLQRTIAVFQGRAEEWIDMPADLVVANIHYQVMRQLIDSPGFQTSKRFVLSGLLRSQMRAISDRLAQLPVRVIRTWVSEGIWHTLYGEVRSANQR